MSQNIEIKNCEVGDFIDYVESLKASDLSDMLASRIVPSFLRTIHNHQFKRFSQEPITYWMVDMLVSGNKPATIQRYSGAIRNLYDAWLKVSGMQKDSSIDFSIPEVAKIDDVAMGNLKRLDKNLKTISNIAGNSRQPQSREYTYRHALQYLLINPNVSLSDLVEMKYSDPQPDIEHIGDIIDSMRKAPQAKYIFPLEQGKRRMPAIIRDLVSGLHAAARSAGLDFGGYFSRDSITSLWIATAIAEGVRYSDINSLLNTLPSDYAFLSLIGSSDLDEEKKTEILNKVATRLSDKTTAWFVMRLRAGVTPDEIKEELQVQRFPALKKTQFYYPTYFAKKIVKKKAATVEVPVLPGILFFRIQYDIISKMMSKIGHLAWCYRTSAASGSPYSAIPVEEMKIFQRSVGSLTSDIEMELVSSLPPLEVGDKVVIENGSALSGQQAVIRKVISVDGTVSYTLRLSDSEYIHWKDVTLPATSVSQL